MKLVRVAVPAAALLLATGCGTPSGATAFTVDGNGVSQQQVDRSAAGCASLIPDVKTAQIRPQVAQYLLYGQLADAVSKRSGVAITPAMQSAASQKMQANQLMSDPECAKAATGATRLAAILSALGEQKMKQQVAATDVVVNPSYGSWDAATLQLSGESGSLSRQDLGQGKVFGN